MLFIFDLWGTLLTTGRSLKKSLIEEGIARDSEEALRIIRILEMRGMQTNKNIKEIINEIGIDILLENPSLDIEWAKKKIIDLLTDQNIELRKGALDALILARKHGKTALLTNTNRDAWEVVKKVGILQYIDKAFPSFETGLSKPDPQAFLNVVNHFGEKIRDSVMIGDSFQSDITPAKLLGMKTVYVGGKKNIYLSLKSFIDSISF